MYPSVSPTTTLAGADMPGVGTAAAPLAPMVTMPVPSAMVALVGVPRVTEKLRWGVEPERSRMGTVMFWAVSPGGKVSTPLWVL